MWGIISVGIDVVGLVVMIVMFIRMRSARAYARSPLRELPPTDRRRLMSVIRQGRPVPADRQELAVRWARQEVLRRGLCWVYLVLGVELAVSLPNDLANSEPRSVAAFWMALVGLCFFISGSALLWRDQLAASRLLRGSARPA